MTDDAQDDTSSAEQDGQHADGESEVRVLVHTYIIAGQQPLGFAVRRAHQELAPTESKAPVQSSTVSFEIDAIDVIGGFKAKRIALLKAPTRLVGPKDHRPIASV
jgi:hypothetical protein